MKYQSSDGRSWPEAAPDGASTERLLLVKADVGLNKFEGPVNNRPTCSTLRHVDREPALRGFLVMR